MTRQQPGIPAQPACGDHCAGEESALVRSLFIVHNMMMRVGDRLSGPIGLTSSRWLLLCALGRLEEAPTVRQLSQDAMLSAQNVSRMVAAMEAEGLVARRTLPGRGRAVFVQLTERGRESLERTKELAERFERRFLHGFDASETRRMESELARLIENLESFERELDAERVATGAGREA